MAWCGPSLSITRGGWPVAEEPTERRSPVRDEHTGEHVSEHAGEQTEHDAGPADEHGVGETDEEQPDDLADIPVDGEPTVLVTPGTTLDQPGRPGKGGRRPVR